MTSYGWDLWTIIGALSVTSLLSALDISVISTALPSIVHDLGSSPAYAWVANGYFLTATAFPPLFGQTANIFGRRALTLLAVLIFAIGSAVSGWAPSIDVLIVGRIIQGIGGGGINVMTQIVVSDLVPLRDRSKFQGIIFAMYSIALSTGPVLGGVLAQYTTWRWIFWLNLPVAGVALVALFLFLQVPYKQEPVSNIFRRVDFIGNAILIASVVSVLMALTSAGTQYPWTSWRVLVPLALGIVGIAGFLVLESTTLIPEPTMPIRIFSNRTSLPTFGVSFVHSLLNYWISYYLPVYFQAVLEASPTKSGVDSLPTILVAMPFAVAAGVGLSALNKFKPFMFSGFLFMTLGYGMFSMFDELSPTAYWVGSQCVAAAGTGMLMTVTLPAIQAPLAESDQAVATATWSFVRSFGGVWGVAIPTAVFNSQVNALVSRVSDSTIRNALKDGGAFSLATKSFMTTLNSKPTLKSEVVSVYVDSLKLVWQVGIGFCFLGCVLSLIVKGIPLREKLKDFSEKKDFSEEEKDFSEDEKDFSEEKEKQIN